MTWLILLRRYWQPIAGILCALVIFGAVRYYGHQRYAAGVQTERALWLPQVIAAEKAQAEADARAKTIATASEANRADLERTHAEALKDLESRADAATRRVASLLRQRAQTARCDSVSAVATSAGGTAGEAESLPGADAAGERLVELARDCESDSLTLSEWQEWYRREAALRQ